MKNPLKLDSIIAVIEFKNEFDELNKYIQNDKSLNELFATKIISVPPDSGMQLFHGENVSPGEALINYNRIQYHLSNVSFLDLNKFTNTFNNLKEARKVIDVKENIEFIGTIFQISYELEEKDIIFLVKRFENFEERIKMTEFRINFLDQNGLNYNIFLNIVENKRLIANIDINTKFSNEKFTLESIIEIAKDLSLDTEKILTYLK